MVVGAIGGVLKLRYLFVIWAFIYVFGTLVIGIYSGGVHYYKTGEAKPLIEATVGKIVGSDAIIAQNVERLKDTGIDSKLASFLRNEILQCFLLIILMWYLFYWVLSKLIRLGISEASMNIWIHIFLVIVSLGIVLIGSALYNGFYFDTWTFPFKGIVELIRNWGLVMTNIGITPEIPSYEGVNETINNITDVGG